MMDGGYGGSSSMSKVPQYHFSGTGESFQLPIYCNSATTVKVIIHKPTPL